MFAYVQGFNQMYPNESNIILIGFSDFDYVGCKLDRKSPSGTCHLLGSSIISWNSKKQACVALSTAEAEYIVVGHACAQSIWLNHQLMDYGVKLEKVPFLSWQYKCNQPN